MNGLHFAGMVLELYCKCQSFAVLCLSLRKTCFANYIFYHLCCLPLSMLYADQLPFAEQRMKGKAIFSLTDIVVNYLFHFFSLSSSCRLYLCAYLCMYAFVLLCYQFAVPFVICIERFAYSILFFI